MKTILLLVILLISVISLYAGSAFQTVGEIGLMLLGKLLDSWSKDNQSSKDDLSW